MLERQGATIKLADLPIEQLASAAKAVEAGGKFIDATLPPISEPNWEGVRRLPVTEGLADWAVQPDPAGPSSKSLAKKPILLGPDLVKKVLFGDPEAATAVVHHRDLATWEHRTGRRPADLPDRLTAYELLRGESSETVEVPKGSELMDVSPDGQLAVLAVGEERDRLDIWSLAEGEHRVGWRPYGDEEVQVRRQGPLVITRRTVSWVRFVDGDHVLTLSHGGKLVCWRLSDVTALFLIDFQRNTSGILTPGRKYAAVFHGTLLRFFDPASGQFCGDLPLPYECTGEVNAHQIAFSPQARELAVVVPGSEVSTVLHWDLSTGQLVSEIPAAKCGIGLDWCDEEHLIVGGGFHGRGFVSIGDSYLIDVVRKAIVWRYALKRGNRLSRGPDSRQWMLSSAATENPVFLGALAFSDDQTLARVDASFPRNMPPLLGPGSRVSVVVGGIDAAGGSDRDRVQSILEEKLRQNGCEVVSGAPVKLTVSCGLKESRTHRYEMIGALYREGDRTFSVTETVYQARLAFVDASGNTLWERTNQFGSGSPGFIVTIPGNQDPQEYLNRQASRGRTGMVESFVKGTRIPRVLYFQPTHDDDVPGLGTTDLDIFSLLGIKATPASRTPPRGASGPDETQPATTSEAVRAGSAAGSGGSLASAGGGRFVRKTLIDLLADDGADLQDRLMWFPAAKRPSIGLRWGVAVQLTGQASGSGVRSLEDLSKLTGPIGPALVKQIEQGMADGAFGQWAESSPPGSRQVAIVGEGNQHDLIRDAEQSGLDVLAVFHLTVKAVGLSLKTDTTMRVRLVDVADGEVLWSSSSLSSSRATAARRSGADPLGQLLASILAELDSGYRLQPMPALAPKHVEGRLAALEERIEGLEQDALLPVLVELRYYQQRNLLPPERLVAVYEKIIGPENAPILAAGDGTQRRQVLEKWLESEGS
jgi:WD40 repeat protein